MACAWPVDGLCMGSPLAWEQKRIPKGKRHVKTKDGAQLNDETAEVPWLGCVMLVWVH